MWVLVPAHKVCATLIRLNPALSIPRKIIRRQNRMHNGALAFADFHPHPIKDQRRQRPPGVGTNEESSSSAIVITARLFAQFNILQIAQV